MDEIRKEEFKKVVWDNGIELRRILIEDFPEFTDWGYAVFAVVEDRELFPYGVRQGKTNGKIKTHIDDASKVIVDRYKVFSQDPERQEELEVD